MRALLLLPLLVTGCVNGVGEPTSESEDQGRTQTFTDGNGDVTNDDDGDSEGNVETPTPPPPDDDTSPGTVVNDDDAQPPAEDDPDGDGAVLVSDEPATAPSEAGQSCSEWTDCGPYFSNANSGFDCVDNSCTCDATGQWATACAGIQGFWVQQDCFCYTETAPMPTIAAVPPQDAVNSADDEDVVCWWRWKDTGCDPDRWIDTSYYEEVCDSYGCDDEYVYDGYYIDGDCYGRWIKRCSNGYEYW